MSLSYSVITRHLSSPINPSRRKQRNANFSLSTDLSFRVTRLTARTCSASLLVKVMYALFFSSCSVIVNHVFLILKLHSLKNATHKASGRCTIIPKEIPLSIFFSAYGSIISHINGSITLEYSRESGALHHGLFIH